MKLATLADSSRDGRLVVVSRDLASCARATKIAPTMQAALDDWDDAMPRLADLAGRLAAGLDAEPFDLGQALAPLPRAYQWCDGSAYLNHVELVRKARGVKMPPEFAHDPLMYQGGSDTMLGCREPIAAFDEAHGIDCEAEIVVVTDDVPAGVEPGEAGKHVKLIGVVNDVSLRTLIPAELAKGFGFFQSKPPTAFAPVFATPDEFGGVWRDGKVHLPLRVWINGEVFGAPEAGEDMQFSFFDLVAHAARTRPLGAGTIVGSGTISNRDSSRGFCCLAEVRMIETIRDGQPATPFLKFGDHVRIDLAGRDGDSVCGDISQKVERRTRN